MALAARQVQITKGDDHIVAVERELVYDRERGIAAEVKKTTVAVDLGNGQVGIATQHEITGVKVGAQPARTAPQPSRPALTYPAPQRNPDPPPSYRTRASSSVGGVKSQVREAKDSSSNQGSFLLDLCNIFTGKVCCLVFLLILVALPVAMIVIGALYFRDCPGQPFIPIWSMAFGSVAVAQISISVMKWCFCRKKDDDDSGNSWLRNCVTLLETVSTLFLFAWLITGSVWVFGYLPHFDQCSEFDTIGCCNIVVFWFSFASILTMYVVGFLACGCCCCFCCVLWLGSSDSSTV